MSEREDVKRRDAALIMVALSIILAHAVAISQGCEIKELKAEIQTIKQENR